MTLYLERSNQWADLLVVLSDIDEKDESRTVSERFIRLNDNKEYGYSGSEAWNITLQDCAHVFGSGHKIRLVIAGGSHPRYIRNLGLLGRLHR